MPKARLVIEKEMRFGSLTVQWEAPRSATGHRLWVCRCSCGYMSVIRQSQLVGGQSPCRSCNARRISERNRKHGMYDSPEYRSWKAMKERCQNPNYHNYCDYGGRGIKVCKRWQKFDAFLADMGRRPSLKHTLDRRNNNGNYTPENCRWATPEEQGNNKRSNTLITFADKTLTVKQWCALLGVTYERVIARLAGNWTFVDAVTTPLRKYTRSPLRKEMVWR